MAYAKDDMMDTNTATKISLADYAILAGDVYKEDPEDRGTDDWRTSGDGGDQPSSGRVACNVRGRKLKWIYFTLSALLIFACSNEPKQNPTEMSIAGSHFKIPNEYLSYEEDFDGGEQDVVTLKFDFDSLGPPAEGIPTYISVRAGTAVQANLRKHPIDTPKTCLENDQRRYEREIVSSSTKGFLTTYHTNSDESYYFYADGSNELYFRCSNAGAPMCFSCKQQVFEGVSASYRFALSMSDQAHLLKEKTRTLLGRFSAEEVK